MFSSNEIITGEKIQVVITLFKINIKYIKFMILEYFGFPMFWSI